MTSKRVSTKAPPIVRLLYTGREDKRVSKTTNSRNMKVTGRYIEKKETIDIYKIIKNYYTLNRVPKNERNGGN